MNYSSFRTIAFLFFLATISLSCDSNDLKTQTVEQFHQLDDGPFISHVVNLSNSKLQMFWKNDSSEIIRTFPRLKNYLKSKNEELVFAMNGGMFTKEYGPLGLYIDKGSVQKQLKTATSGYGNFYMQPNGVFYISKDDKAAVVTTQNFQPTSNIEYATQSGPMLISEGKINGNFGPKSTSLHIRNGVGILPNGNVLFAISKERVNFYSFAEFFENKGCKNALYLDGFVSRMYLPKKGINQMDGNFGVMIAEVK